MELTDGRFNFLYLLFFLGGCFFNPPTEPVAVTAPVSVTTPAPKEERLVIDIGKTDTRLSLQLPDGRREEQHAANIAELGILLDEVKVGENGPHIYLRSAAGLPHERFQQTVEVLRRKGISKFSIITTP